MQMTPEDALQEIRDRVVYFCLRTDGRYDQQWTQEIERLARKETR